jgi:hypothetical protein
MKFFIHLSIASKACETRSLSFSFRSTHHLCRNDIAMYSTSVGALTNDFSIVILFLVFHNAQAKPAKKNMISLFGKGPLPCNQVTDNSSRDEGHESRLNTF